MYRNYRKMPFNVVFGSRQVVVVALRGALPGDAIAVGLSSAGFEHTVQVRRTPSWPRSWANFSLI